MTRVAAALVAAACAVCGAVADDGDERAMATLMRHPILAEDVVQREPEDLLGPAVESRHPPGGIDRDGSGLEVRQHLLDEAVLRPYGVEEPDVLDGHRDLAAERQPLRWRWPPRKQKRRLAAPFRIRPGAA